jgi:hypothetical protein
MASFKVSILCGSPPQIELVFKWLKSIFHYNEIPSKVEKSGRAWFYGKLLLAAVCETLVNQGRFPFEETSMETQREEYSVEYAWRE